MRQHEQFQTMAAAYTQICRGVRPWTALGNFMHDWFGCAKDQREQLVSDPLTLPTEWTQEAQHWAAFIAASVEWLCQKYAVPCPTWVNDPMYILPETWWYADGLHKPHVRARVMDETPEPFVRRNIYCGNRMYNNKYEVEDLVAQLLEARKSVWQ